MTTVAGRLATEQRPIGKRIKELVSHREFGVFMALLIFFVVMYTVSPVFRRPFNLVTIMKQISVTGVIAMGQTMVIISGAFDLSQAPVAGLVGMLTAVFWKRLGFSPAAAICAALAVGALCGFVNGVLAARLRLHPIVMTLASGSMFMGINYFVSQGQTITGLPSGLKWLGQGNIGGVPVLVIVLFLVSIVMHILLTRTLFGQRVLMVGGNLKAATDIGINVEKIRIGIFTISGFLAGLGGIILLGRVGNAIPQLGQLLLFPVVTATIVGGTLLSGGVGSMLGTLMGAAIMGIVNNAMAVLQANIFLQDFFQGTLVVIALLVDVFRRGELTWAILIGKER
jgi:ribose/xylose/arabinose/galactoside ABC-type transport system permease subunit